MSFNTIGTLSPHGAPVLRRETITNSEATSVAYSVKLSSGFITAGTAGALVYGHITGHSTLEGVGVNTTGVAGAAMGSYAGTYTAASDNQTVGFVKAECDISKFTLVSADLDATIGTTTGSNLPGYFCDLDSATELDESDTTTTTMQYALHGVDPRDSANAVASIYESQVFGV